MCPKGSLVTQEGGQSFSALERGSIDQLASMSIFHHYRFNFNKQIEAAVIAE